MDDNSSKSNEYFIYVNGIAFFLQFSIETNETIVCFIFSRYYAYLVLNVREWGEDGRVVCLLRLNEVRFLSLENKVVIKDGIVIVKIRDFILYDEGFSS